MSGTTIIGSLICAMIIAIGLFKTMQVVQIDERERAQRRQPAQPTQPKKPAPNPVKEARNALQIAKLEKQLATAQAQNLSYQEKIQKLSPDWAKAAKNKTQINAYKTRIDANNLVMDKIIDLQVAKQEYDG